VPTPAGVPLGITTAFRMGGLVPEIGHQQRIGRVTTAERFASMRSHPTTGAPTVIATGPDSNIWLTRTEGGQQYRGQITPTGVLPISARPSGIPAFGHPSKDGITDSGFNRVGGEQNWQKANQRQYCESVSRFPPAIGYPLGHSLSVPNGATVVHRKAAITNRDRGRITLARRHNRVPLGPQTRSAARRARRTRPTATPYPGWLATGPDGAIWFTEAIGIHRPLQRPHGRQQKQRHPLMQTAGRARHMQFRAALPSPREFIILVHALLAACACTGFSRVVMIASFYEHLSPAGYHGLLRPALGFIFLPLTTRCTRG